MPKYHVHVPQVHYQTVAVEADSPGKAIRLVMEGEGNEIDNAPFSHVLDESAMAVTDMASGKTDIYPSEDEEE